MKKELITNYELRRLIALKAGKIDFEYVEDEDFSKIKEFTFNAYLINGEKSNINLDIIELFPNIERIRICNFEVTNEVISKLCRLECLSSIEIVGGIFQEVDFSKLADNLRYLSFENCESLPFKYPKIKNIQINKCKVDLKNIDLSLAENIVIINSTVQNVHNLDEFVNIKSINLDGTILYDENENIVENISVSEHTEYSHEDESIYYDSHYRE